MRTITTKTVQTHTECACGCNSVDQETMQVRWKDLRVLKIRRKKDRKTGKFFLLQYFKIQQCEACAWWEFDN